MRSYHVDGNAISAPPNTTVAMVPTRKRRFVFSQKAKSVMPSATKAPRE